MKLGRAIVRTVSNPHGSGPCHLFTLHFHLAVFFFAGWLGRRSRRRPAGDGVGSVAAVAACPASVGGARLTPPPGAHLATQGADSPSRSSARSLNSSVAGRCVSPTLLPRADVVLISRFFF